MRRRIVRVSVIVLAALALALVALLVTGGSLLRGSLACLEGEVRLDGLVGPVTVERDAQGVPTIRGRSRRDIARAQGYVHAQERFFQMDLLRRAAAGELAELLGAPLLTQDRDLRRHRFRTLAATALDRLDPVARALVDAYTDGVNAGLEDLRTRPFEYFVLRQKPEPWRPVDSLLVIYAMFLDLSRSGIRTDLMRGVAADVLPPELADFLQPRGCRWEAPLMGPAGELPPLPGPEVMDLRDTETAPAEVAPTEPPPVAPRAETAGSNSWAVAGALTAHGGALLANDMHLGLRLPNIWYRMRLEWPAADGPRSCVGVTLPGVPALVVGSNEHVAWGFTNSYGDWLDLVVLQTDPADSNRYLTPEGWATCERIPEIITVKGAAPDTLWIRQTCWGPVWTVDHLRRPLVLCWTAHDPDAVNLGLVALEDCTTVTEAVATAAAAGIPPQSFICADQAGGIAWTIAGAMPRRLGWDGRTPVSWADGACRWDGFLTPEEHPRVVNPPEGRLWSANTRAAAGPALAVVGDGGYGLGARAQQIRDALRALDRPDERDLLAVQLDDRALFLESWRDLVLAVLAQRDPNADGEQATARAAFAQIVDRDWEGRAVPGSVAYRLMDTCIRRLVTLVYDGLTAACVTADAEFDARWLSYRYAVVWELLSARPAHMLPPEFADWDALVLEAVDRTMEAAAGDGRDLAAYTWGAYNTVAVAHPFADVLPLVGRRLAAPARRLPGGSHMPRVQHPRFGASERLVVSPGREEEALFHMPGGQSGHPLSPFFLAGHQAWVEGRPTPLLPGPGRYLLTLSPTEEAGP